MVFVRGFRSWFSFVVLHFWVSLTDHMAPVWLACRLSLQLLSLSVLFGSLVLQDINALLTYDRQTLLDLRIFTDDPEKRVHGGHE